MASYRFCRSDDWALLARAHDLCVRPHAPELAALDVEALKRAAREIGVWAGLCMIAQEGGEPIGVVLSAKRESEVLVWRLGVRPDRRRRGHGRHLLESLASKLAILGPRRIVADVPATAGAALRLLEACGFSRESEWLDWTLERVPEASGAPELLSAVSLDDLESAGVLDAAAPRPWEQTLPALRARRAGLRGLAAAPGERVEAHALWEDGPGERRILALDAADPERAVAWLGLLLSRLAVGAPGPVRLCRVDARRNDAQRLEALGFRRAEVTLRLAATA